MTSFASRCAHALRALVEIRFSGNVQHEISSLLSPPVPPLPLRWLKALLSDTPQLTGSHSTSEAAPAPADEYLSGRLHLLLFVPLAAQLVGLAASVGQRVGYIEEDSKSPLDDIREAAAALIRCFALIYFRLCF